MNLTTIYLHASKKNQTKQIGKAAGCRRPAGERESGIEIQDSGFRNQKLEIRNQLPSQKSDFVHRNLICFQVPSQKFDFLLTTALDSKLQLTTEI